MARIIGIDYGSKRTGLSVTDPDQIIVSPLKTVNTNSFLNFLDQYLQDEAVEKLVFGYPTHKDGTPTYVVDEIQLLIKKIKEKHPNLQFDFQDENFTSAEAMQILIRSGVPKKKRKDKERLDRLSAVLILQRYLKHI